MWKSGTEQYGRIDRLYATAASVKVWDSGRGEYVFEHVQLSRLSPDD
jgi:hypothetical protein